MKPCLHAALAAWAVGPGTVTPLSIVYLHGWQGTRWDYDPVFDRVARSLGANVYYARLRGYGTTTEEIVDVTLDDCVNDAWEALQIGHRIGERVMAAGSSMGADLALWLASRRESGVSALVLLSAAVQTKDTRADMLLWPWPFGNVLLAIAMGKYIPNPFLTDVYPTGSAELYARHNPPPYRSESMMKLTTVVTLTRTLPLESIAAPSLWLYNEKDNAVDIPTLKAFYDRTGGTGKRLVGVPDAHAHMMAGDIFQPDTTDGMTGDILAFLRETLP